MFRKSLYQIVSVNMHAFSTSIQHEVTKSCKNPSLGAFRTLLRAAKETFQSDAIAIKRCKDEVRRHFFLNSQETDSEKIKALIAEAFDAASFLKESVVQAKLNSKGVYEMKVGAVSGADDVIRVQEASSAAADGSESARNKSANSGCGREGGCGCAS
jgi:complex III assembly factor LYRM7